MNHIENTNKAIAINSIILYVKLIIVTIFGLLTTRFALRALGVVDFGLFSVVGSIITFIAIFNTIMVATSNRYISVAIGKGNAKSTNEQFNICLVIHSLIAVITILLALPLGDFYIINFINYDGNIGDAVWVYNFSLIGSVISFIGVPYNGLLMAKERFAVFCITDILIYFCRLVIAYMLIWFFENKLIVYALTQGIFSASATVIYIVYCKRHFKDIIRWNFVKDKGKYTDILYFSGWVSFGAFATVGKSQCAALLVNTFFNTIMNAALGLANTVNGLLTTFANAVAQPIAPQITKSYSRGDMKRCDMLLVWSIKVTYFVMLVVSLPFLINADWIFGIWLGQIPDYVIPFTKLIIIDTLISSLNSGISNFIFASGKIKRYQLSINLLRFAAIIGAFFVLKLGAPASSLLYVYIFFSVLIFFTGQYVLKITLHYNNALLWKNSYVPSLLVTLFSFPLLMLQNLGLHPIMQYIIGEIWLLNLIYLIGLNKSDRRYITSKIRDINIL